MSFGHIAVRSKTHACYATLLLLPLTDLCFTTMRNYTNLTLRSDFADYEKCYCYEMSNQGIITTIISCIIYMFI